MVQLIEGYVFSPFEFGSAPIYGGKFGFCGIVARMPALEVNAPGLAHELRACAVLLLLDFLHLLRNFTRERDRYGEQRVSSQHPMIG